MQRSPIVYFALITDYGFNLTVTKTMICTPKNWTNFGGAFMGKQSKYKPEFKLFIAKKYLNDGMIYWEIMKKYFPHLKIGGGGRFIKKWVEIYEKEGFDGLKINRQGLHLKKKTIKVNKKKSNVVDTLYLKMLENKLEFYEAENDYLKKLEALVLKKNSLKTAKKSK